MYQKPSLTARIAIGKIMGLVFGAIAFASLSYFVPNSSLLFRWGILLWYATFGMIIGVFGVINYHPILKLPLPWWFRAPLLGSWMNFVLTFFTYDVMHSILVVAFGENGFFNSPFWFVLEGGIIGFIIGFFATYFGGEGKRTVERYKI